MKDTWYSRSFNNRDSYEITRCFVARRYSWSDDYYSDWFFLCKYIIIQVDIEFKFTRELINYYVDRWIRDTNLYILCINDTTVLLRISDYFHAIFRWCFYFSFSPINLLQFFDIVCTSLINYRKFRWKLLFDFDKWYNCLNLNIFR